MKKVIMNNIGWVALLLLFIVPTVSLVLVRADFLAGVWIFGFIFFGVMFACLDEKTKS